MTGQYSTTVSHKAWYWHHQCSAYLPTAHNCRFIYADDICLAAQAATFTEIECSLISAMSDAQRLILSQTASQTKPVQNYHQHISSA